LVTLEQQLKRIDAALLETPHKLNVTFSYLHNRLILYR
jgi:hypothetical protein